MNTFKRFIALVMSMVLSLMLLSGCVSEPPKDEENNAIVSDNSPVNTPEISFAQTNDIGKEEPVTVPQSETVATMTDEQRNSLNMLNYLAFISQEILAKKNNRVYIEKVYSSLINDINPSTVNDLTESHYMELLDDLHKFELLLTKRDRLQYLFEQNQAQAMRNAIPNPMALLSLTNAANLVSLVTSVAYMAIDAVASYQTGMSSAEQAFLQGSWELDDEESNTVHSLRTQTFMYMVEIVKEYDLPDKLTLSENKVDKLVDWNEKTETEASAASKVHFYQTYEKEYEGFGQYWLARAKAHFDNKEYEDCLKAIQQYEQLNIGIYRQDYELAKVLPVAIGAASQIYDDKNYVSTASRYAEMILNNTDIKNDWALRYFVAQTYIDLCGRSKDYTYLRKAYKIALENVNELKAAQMKLNNEYLADLKLEEIPKDANDQKKKEIEEYNKQKKLERETELPPVYEPLKLNLDLLYALAEQLEIDDAEKNKMESILFVGGTPLFLSIPMNELYNKPEKYDYPVITYTGKDITIPADHLSPDAKIVTIMNEGNKSITISDWSVTKVERKNRNNVSTYIVTYHSKQAETYDFKKAETVLMNIKSIGSSSDEVYTFKYKVKNSKEWLIIDKAEFEEIK